MSPAGTIILASDLTARSDRATDRACLLAREWAAPLLLVHVVEGDWSDETVEARAADALGTILDSEAALAEIVVRRGDVQREILKLAEERAAALIVTGVARFNNVSDFFLGTAVDHLVRHAPMPVLVVKRRVRLPYRQLLVATDFSSCSQRALRAAVELFPEAELTLWHNCHAAYEAWLDKDATAAEARLEAEEQMQRFLADADIADDVRRGIKSVISTDELQRSGEHQLREGGFDLLVLGTHGRSGFAHATIGSRAAELLNNVSSDVLMVRGPKR